VWVACFVGVTLILRGKMVGMKSTDVAVGVVFLTLVILPIVNHFWFRLLGALRLTSQIPPVLAVVSSCDAAAKLPWGELKFSG
jgi:hypothetical protein